MKPYLFIATVILVANSLKATTSTTCTILEQQVKEIIYVSVKVTSDNGPVEGAIIKINSQGYQSLIFRHESKTDHNGFAKFKIEGHDNPSVNVEVSHPLYKDRRIKAVTLKHSHVVFVHLITKETTVDATLNENNKKKTDKERSVGFEHKNITNKENTFQSNDIQRLINTKETKNRKGKQIKNEQPQKIF